MRDFKNNIGCIMSFDDDISEEQIKIRLRLFGKVWIEEKDKKFIRVLDFDNEDKGKCV